MCARIPSPNILLVYTLLKISLINNVNHTIVSFPARPDDKD